MKKSSHNLASVDKSFPEHLLAANAIRAARDAGNLSQAVADCKRAIARMPGDPYFPRILADLYFEAGKFDAAFIALADYLVISPPSQRDHFAKRYARFRRVLSREQMERYASLLDSALEEANIDEKVTQWAQELLQADLPIPDITTEAASPEITDFISKLGDDSDFFALAKLEKTIEKRYQNQLLSILDSTVLSRPRGDRYYRIDLFCSSIYERLGRLEESLKILSELLRFRLDPVAARTLLRICRLMNSYEEADTLLRREPSLLKTDEFNILYELAYYYEFKDDIRQVLAILRKIENGFGQNLPVLRTVRNFYIRFGMLDEAQRIEPMILNLYKSKPGGSARFLESLAESDAEVTSKMQQLYSELEHQKQLAAISDLTTGISHELGQPITNIRYTIQFYRRLFEKKLSKEGVFAVFDSILEETRRMGGLIGRLSPLTSSKAVFESFDIIDRIRKRIQTEQARLQEGKISVKITSGVSIYVYGDPVKFDQLISNLLLNSVDAIHDRKEIKKNEIRISVEQSKQETLISFSDNGVGIPYKNRNTIFDPFFSTKPPGKGEGLGLFIVWNLLKMQGGTISVDTNYNDGAKFDIRIPIEMKH